MAQGGSSGAKDPQLQRSVFRWVQAEDEAAGRAKPLKLHAQITASEVAIQYGVPEDALVKHIRGEIEEAESCQSLPFTLLMVISYTLMVIKHDPVVPINAVEDSLAHDIESNANFAFSSDYIGHKSIYDVNSIADFWSWMNLGLLPLLFIQERGFAEGREMEDPRIIAAQFQVPREDRGFILNYNRMVGGLRIRQERGDAGECETLNVLWGFYGKPCVKGLGYELYPDLWEAKTSEEPRREFWLWASDDVSELYNIINIKETETWLDDVTRKVEIAVPVFNGQYGVHSIIFVNFFFSRGGHIWKRIIAMSTYSRWFHDVMNIIPDVLWLGCLLWIFGSEAFKIHQVYSGTGCKGIRNDYLSFWNVTDWASVFVGCWIIYGYFMRFNATSDINSELQALGDISEVLDRPAYEAQAARFLDVLEEEVNDAHVFRVVLGIYPMLIVLRLFKAFAAQPRLSLVTRTLGSAAIDLIHFLLVFTSIFMTYAIAGVVLFGRDVDGFTNLTRATATCFRAMMGDFDWEELLSVGRFEAGLWFSSFMVVIVLLMLNMLLAIVMDSYSEQKQIIGDAETLWMEFMQALHRWKGQREGRLVSLKEVYKSIRMAGPGAFAVVRKQDPGGTSSRHHLDIGGSSTPNLKSQLTYGRSGTSDLEKEAWSLVQVKSMLDVCPRMRQAQAEELIKNAILDYYAENRENTNTEEMLRIIRKVNFSTKKLKRFMKQSVLAQSQEPEVDDDGQRRVTLQTVNRSESSFDRGVESQASKGGGTFGSELEVCKKELRHAQEWIGEDELGDAPLKVDLATVEGPSMSEATGELERGDFVDKATGHVYYPLQSLDEVQWASVRRVMPSREFVLQACRQAKIGPENDYYRIQVLGRAVRVLDTDADDRTVKVRAPGISRDLWLGLNALTYIQPEEPRDAYGTTKQRRASSEDLSQGSETNTNEEEQLQRMHDLEAELRVGRQTVSEALTAVCELEGRLLKEHEDKAKIATKFQLLKKKVVSLTRENRKLLEEGREMDERIGIVSTSKDEYFELVDTLTKENHRLKSKLTGQPMQLALDNTPYDGRHHDHAARDRSRDRSAPRDHSRGDRHHNGHRGHYEDDRHWGGHHNGRGGDPYANRRYR